MGRLLRMKGGAWGACWPFAKITRMGVRRSYLNSLLAVRSNVTAIAKPAISPEDEAHKETAPVREPFLA